MNGASGWRRSNIVSCAKKGLNMHLQVRYMRKKTGGFTNAQAAVRRFLHQTWNLKVVLDGPAFSKFCPGFSKREKIPSYFARASNTIVLSVKAITAMFSMMGRLLPVSDIATMVRRLSSRQTKRRCRKHDVNSFLIDCSPFPSLKSKRLDKNDTWRCQTNCEDSLWQIR